MSIITVKAVFNRRKMQLIDNELASVELYVYQPSPRIKKYIGTGISLMERFWNSETATISPKHPQAPHLNKMLRDAIASIEDYAYSLRASGKALTEQMLIDHIRGKRLANDSFLAFIKAEIDPALKRGTRKEHNYTYNLLAEFRRDILFTEVNYSLVQEFDRFMRFDKGLKQNTIHKHHQHVNRFLKLASLKELYPERNNPYTMFKSKKELSDRNSLSPDELARIESLPPSPVYPELQLVKDMFLFSCYTGLRFSDITTLERKHIVDRPEGLCVVKKMEKVPKPITLPLALLFDGKPLEILHRYNANPVFPAITNQHANRLLKTIATSAQTNMRLTFHIARHTFGSMLADKTQNPYLIMDLMGHADIKTSMIYIHSSQERINRQLRGVKWT